MNPELESALQSGEINEIYRLAKRATVNIPNFRGESALEIAIDQIEDSVLRVEVVTLLLQAGADPNLRPNNECGPLFSAVLQKDTEVIRALLEAGADPNVRLDANEPIYSWSEFDYRHDEFDLQLPEDATTEEQATEDTWLLYLDRLAVKYKKRRPDYLFVIREYGGKNCKELESDT